MESVETVEKPFHDVFGDAMRFHLLACNTTGMTDDLIGACSRSSILHCVFTLESLANCMIHSLDLGESSLKALERLGTLDKLNLFLGSKGLPELELGVGPVQGIKQLFKLRNDYVHPKNLSFKDEYHEDEGVLKRDILKYQELDIPKHSILWGPPHAEKVLEATDCFLSYFFLEVLGWSPTEVATQTQTVVLGGDSHKVTYRHENIELFEDVMKIGGLKLDYILFPEDRTVHNRMEYREANKTQHHKSDRAGGSEA